MKKEYITENVCSKKISIEVEDGIILSADFSGGCPGNTNGISLLVKGMPVKDAIERLSGIKCGPKSTSCPDQLAKALVEFAQA